MKLLTVLAAPLLLLVLPACPSEECISAGPPPSAQAGLFLVDEQVKLPLRPQVTTFCSDEEVAPASFSAEILDPDQLPVQSQAQLSAQGPTVGMVEFTPRKLGRHHLFAAFEPMGGIHQFSFYTARDRTAESTIHHLPLQCPSVQRTRSGAFTCGDGELYRDGVSIKQFPFDSTLAITGDVVWNITPLEITRYVDTGQALQATGVLKSYTNPIEAMVATETELVVLHANKLQRIVFDGQQLSLTGETLWEPPSQLLTYSTRGVMLRVGDRLALISSVPTQDFPRMMRACPYQLEQGRFVRTQEDCEVMTGMVAGFESSVLWIGEQSPGLITPQALRRLEWTGTQWLERGRLDLGVVLSLSSAVGFRRLSVVPVLSSPHFSQPPALRNALPVYEPGQSQLRLEVLDKETLNAQASSSLFWGMAPALTRPGLAAEVRVRPAAP